MDVGPSTEMSEESGDQAADPPLEESNEQQSETTIGDQLVIGQAEYNQSTNQPIEQPVGDNATVSMPIEQGNNQEHSIGQHIEVHQEGDDTQTDAQTDSGNKDWQIEVTKASVTNDQEMGLAVAILELIGSQPHIVVNEQTEADVADQQGDDGQPTEYVDVAVKASNQTMEQSSATQPGDTNQQQQQQPAYPVMLHVIPDDQQTQVTPEAAVAAAAATATTAVGVSATAVGTAAAAATRESAAESAADVEGTEDASGHGDAKGDIEQREAAEKGKRKRGRPKGAKKKKGPDEGGKVKQEQPSKKKKKIEKEKHDTASTSSDTPDKEKKVSAPKNFFCTICSAAFNRKDNLKVHSRTKHNTDIPDAGTSKTKCLNPKCDKTFYHKTQMLRHMEEEHGLEVQKKEMEFKSLEEFKKWKVEEETKKYVFFSSYRGPAANKNGKDSHLYFKCQKDGPNRPHRKLGEPGRKTERRNKKGSVKTGLLCPARMICKVCGKTGKVHLTYIYSHSHTITCSDTEHQPLPNPLKKELIEKLALGTPVKQLYRDLRKVSVEPVGKDSSSQGVEAVHYVSQRTLELMKHRLDMSRRLHHEESTSILLLVDQLKSKPYNPVLLYKPHGGVAVVGDESLMHLPFADDLSVLALQTEEQMKVLQQGGTKVIYVDTTHANNPTNHKLISLVVPDSYQQGYAVAHLIANRIDEHLLYYFVKAIKERCDALEPSVVMTDEENTGLGVFQAVFPGVTFTHLLSKWHVHRAWLKRMNRDIPNVSLRQEMYHCLVLMMEEPNVNKLNEMASNFVNHYASKSQTFTEYFVELYRARTELWAMCHRSHPDGKIDDVIFMSNYHSNLKAYFGQKRKSSKRIDSLVNILLDIDRDDSWKRVKKAFKDTANDPEAGPLSHHDRGMMIPEDHVEEVGEQDTTWLVASHDPKGVKHMVKKLINTCIDDNCYLKCLELSCFSLCHHLYECSCFDEVSICQHVHRVHSIRASQLQQPQSLLCTPAADLGAYVEIHYMDEDDTVGIATQNIQTSEVVPAAVEAPAVIEVPSDTVTSGAAQVGTLQSRLQHLVNLLGNRQVDDLLLNHVTGTVDQLISTCEAASNIPVTQA